MATFTQIGPLRIGLPIVDKVGGPTPQFMRAFNGLFGNTTAVLGVANTAVTGLDTKADKVTQILAGDGLTGGGNLSADRTLNVGAGTGITVNANDVAIDTTAEAERIRDVMGVALVQGTGITITPNDGADQITIACSITQYNDEMAQDAVGTILTDSATIDFTYNVAGTITAIVIAGSIGPTQLADTAVAPGTYGDSTHAAQFTVDQDGRLTAASQNAMSAGSAFAFDGGSASIGGRGFVLDGGDSNARTDFDYWIDGGAS